MSKCGGPTSGAIRLPPRWKATWATSLLGRATFNRSIKQCFEKSPMILCSYRRCRSRAACGWPRVSRHNLPGLQERFHECDLGWILCTRTKSMCSAYPTRWMTLPNWTISYLHLPPGRSPIRLTPSHKGMLKRRCCSVAVTLDFVSADQILFLSMIHVDKNWRLGESWRLE